jgi:8-oxo-dGTP pyrophosphatase MutT (NUDIX family)
MGLAMPSDDAQTLLIRPAATTVLWRNGANGPEVLMGQRGAQAAFMPSKYVFPGGAVDEADEGAALGITLHPDCAARLRMNCPPDAPAPETLAVAALRELWEETGLRLAPSPHDAEGLRFIFRAITPPGRSRRFDARFFLANAARIEGNPDDFSDASDELSHLHWIAISSARSLDLPFITEVVLSEISHLLRGESTAAGVPFFDNSGHVPTFRRLG